MKSKTTKPHRGQALAAAVEATNLNKEDVAKKAGYSRSSYYKHIEIRDLEYHILAAYGRAIGHDFSDDIPGMPKYLLEDPEEKYSKPATLQEAITQRDFWKDKYLELLEKYNRVIEENFRYK